MKKSKSSLSKSESYIEIGEFWDKHDLTEFQDKIKEASFKVAIESEVTYYAVDKNLSEKIQKVAHQRGIAANTLLNLWVQEKLHQQKASSIR